MSQYTYRAFGLQITSDWPLPSLAPATFDHADLIIRHDTIAPHLGANWTKNHKSYKNWEAMPGSFVMRVNEVATFLARHGNTILIERASSDVDDDAVTAHMMGSILAAVLQQRGAVLLHGSAVRIGDRAVALLGKSGAGKSTLATKLSMMGYPLVTDDIVAIQRDEVGRPNVMPAFPTSRLWDDAVKHLNFGAQVKQRVRPELDKYLVAAPVFDEELVPLRAAYVLGVHNEPNIEIETVDRTDAYHELHQQGFRNGFLAGHQSLGTHFEAMMEVARSVDVFTLTRPRDGFAIDRLADALIAHQAASAAAN